MPLNGYANCTDGQLRLVGGTELSGHVEICYNRVWFGVCADIYYWYYNRATICKGLGFSSQGTVYICVMYYCTIIVGYFMVFYYYGFCCLKNFIHIYNLYG